MDDFCWVIFRELIRLLALQAFKLINMVLVCLPYLLYSLDRDLLRFGVTWGKARCNARGNSGIGDHCGFALVGQIEGVIFYPDFNLI